ncbi:MAG: MFS transporter [Candidatus Falkowbacteria bacterium]
MKKIFSKKNTFIFSVTLLSSLAIFAVARPAHASEVIAGIIGGILSVVIYFIGQLLSLVISVLISIAQYSAFGTAAPVVFGWMIVRDICNMFFVLILLIIAFATILHVEEYNYKKWLPKLIMMAVLINFSRLICNIFVDFAQVVMLTFVNGFKDVGGGNLTEMLGINDWIGTMSTDPTATVTFTTIVGTYLLALIYSIIALITVVTMVAVLAMRMVMLWIYITLSPLAYLLSAFPQGQQYASKWWSEFSKNLVIGPILAFFIWLSFASLGGTADLAANNATDPLKGIPSDPSSTPSVGLTESGSADNMIKFIISIGMLLGGLQIAQELGGEAGKMAGKVSSKGFSMAKAGAGAAGLYAAKRAGAGAAGAAGSAANWAGQKINLAGKSVGLKGDTNLMGRALQKTGAIGTGLQADMITTRKKAAVKSRQELLEKLGFGETGATALVEATEPIKRRLDFGDKIKKSISANTTKGQSLLTDGQELIDRGEDAKVKAMTAGKLRLTGEKERQEGENTINDADRKIKFNENEIINLAKNNINDPRIAQIRQENKKLEDDKIHGQSMIDSGQSKLDDVAAIEAAAATADADIAKGVAMKNQGTEILNKKGFSSTAFGKNVIKMIPNIGDMAVGTTNKAAKKMAEESLTAKDFVKNIKNTKEWPDYIRDTDAHQWAGKSSMNSQQKANFKAMAGDPEASEGVRVQLEKWSGERNADGSHDKDFLKVADAISRAIAGHQKGGGDMKNLSGISSLLTTVSSEVSNPKVMKSPSDYKDKVSYSNYNRERSVAQGGFSAAKFNENQESDKTKSANSIAIDFAELQGIASFGGKDFKTNADAANLDSGQIKDFTVHLESKLQGMKPNDGGYQELQTAINNLKNNKVEALSIRNSGVKKGFRGDLAAEYHENTHKAGVKSEDLAHGLESMMMDMRLTGSDKTTKENNSFEVGQKAAALERQGVPHDKILEQMKLEIVDRGGKHKEAFAQPAPVNVDLKNILSGGGQPTIQNINNTTNNNTSINNVVNNVLENDKSKGSDILQDIKKQGDKTFKTVADLKKSNNKGRFIS